MKEDIIEILTSKLFANDRFSGLLMELSRFSTFDEEKKFITRLRNILGLRPKDVGISPYLTLDKTCKLESVWHELHPSGGDVGGSSNKPKLAKQEISHEPCSIQEFQFRERKNTMLSVERDVAQGEQFLDVVARLSNSFHEEAYDMGGVRTMSEQTKPLLLREERKQSVLEDQTTEHAKQEVTFQDIQFRLAGGLGKPYSDCVD